MALFWLKAVPWSAILSNAPHIVEGAKKLASLVRTKPPGQGSTPAHLGTRPDGSLTDLAAVDARLQALEQQQQQMAELLRALADNNAEMARALEVLRARSRLTLRLAVIALIGLVVLVAWLVGH